MAGVGGVVFGVELSARLTISGAVCSFGNAIWINAITATKAAPTEAPLVKLNFTDNFEPIEFAFIKKRTEATLAKVCAVQQ